MMSTIIIALGVPALVALLVNWRSLFWGAFHVVNRYLGRSVTNVVSMAMVCMTIYCIGPVLEYTLLLIWSYMLLELVDHMTDNFFRLPSVVFFCLVSYIQFWNFIGRDIMMTLNHALVWFLREYRWKRFIMDCLSVGRFGIASRVVLYFGDWIHSVVVGDWKVIVLMEFHAKHYPGPQPPLYAQLRHRFLRELQAMTENGVHPNSEIGVAVEDIIAIACGFHD
ncbi:uncharacterized protein F4807DRAFT_464588 [Annulohypoxylon truncatum]|uniref:uncharacterized protein n=1 Tax=Annulohypoxylon truncatum TaxID=327061 RepID=UPI002008C6B6|nr:uncharacterized protein F4807DRAFT_464588 [Annulohypoxylon truncatum]KAI1205502.1 hypothetical protein F4807DRAFT_464588 [Annulohypoxylon truncatum]